MMGRLKTVCNSGAQGLMYFGNSMGLLIYDGEKWESINLNNSIVRSLAKDSNDKIYYGAQGELTST